MLIRAKTDPPDRERTSPDAERYRWRFKCGAPKVELRLRMFDVGPSIHTCPSPPPLVGSLAHAQNVAHQLIIPPLVNFISWSWKGGPWTSTTGSFARLACHVVIARVRRAPGPPGGSSGSKATAPLAWLAPAQPSSVHHLLRASVPATTPVKSRAYKPSMPRYHLPSTYDGWGICFGTLKKKQWCPTRSCNMHGVLVSRDWVPTLKASNISRQHNTQQHGQSIPLPSIASLGPIWIQSIFEVI